MTKKYIACFVFSCALAAAGAPKNIELPIGLAQHAFDHLGAINDQAEAAAASGANVIYTTGFGAWGYEGLPSEEDIQARFTTTGDYLDRARKEGIQVAIGYVCATSIVKLDTFDRNWPQSFRRQFSSPPSAWLQVGIDGKPLASWYGGDYRPACMNNPDWRTYEKAIVRMQLDSGHDGIFFDNPTVHPQGCYCEHCMKQFAKYLASAGIKLDPASASSVNDLRKLAKSRPDDFLHFRSTIARDFLDDIRRFARTIKPNALITCNNSLNAPSVFFSQSRNYGYNIHEMSKVEDLVVVEDSNNQPRTLANGSTLEYGHVYELLHAISHNKPVVAVTIADGDYHTAPNLMRLAMAEAAAHNASYLSWPTWPDKERERMCVAVRPEANLLRQCATFLNSAPRRADVVLYLPIEKWPTLSDVQLLQAAAGLQTANIQFVAACENNITERLKVNPTPIVLALGTADDAPLKQFRDRKGLVIPVSDKNWFSKLQLALKSSLKLEAPSSVRAVVHDQPKRTIVHLLNLNVQRLSSFEDKVTPVSGISMKLRVPMKRVRSVQALTVDEYATHGKIDFVSEKDPNGSLVSIQVPHLGISTIVVVE
jgi:hypothetical protein